MKLSLGLFFASILCCSQLYAESTSEIDKAIEAVLMNPRVIPSSSMMSPLEAENTDKDLIERQYRYFEQYKEKYLNMKKEIGGKKPETWQSIEIDRGLSGMSSAITGLLELSGISIFRWDRTSTPAPPLPNRVSYLDKENWPAKYADFIYALRSRDETGKKIEGQNFRVVFTFNIGEYTRQLMENKGFYPKVLDLYSHEHTIHLPSLQQGQLILDPETLELIIRGIYERMSFPSEYFLAMTEMVNLKDHDLFGYKAKEKEAVSYREKVVFSIRSRWLKAIDSRKYKNLITKDEKKAQRITEVMKKQSEYILKNLDFPDKIQISTSSFHETDGQQEKAPYPVVIRVLDPKKEVVAGFSLMVPHSNISVQGGDEETQARIKKDLRQLFEYNLSQTHNSMRPGLTPVGQCGRLFH